MTRRPGLPGRDPRLRALEGKLELLAQVREGRSARGPALLLELLCDPSWTARDQAVEALVERGQEMVAPLKELLVQGLWYTRAAAAEALGRIGALEAVDLLAVRFADENPNVRATVAGALAALARRHGSKPVRAALERSGGIPDATRLRPLGAAGRELARRLEEAGEGG